MTWTALLHVQQIALLALLTLTGQQRIVAASAAPAAAQVVGSQLGSRESVLPRFARDPPPTKSLFVDNALFANLSGDISLVRHRPAPAGIVLVPDKPWETFGLIGYHTVIQVGHADYRMYYVRAWLIPGSMCACTVRVFTCDFNRSILLFR